MPKSSPILIWSVCAAVLVLSNWKASARDLGQWEGVDPLHREWFNGLMRPDNPGGGKADIVEGGGVEKTKPSEPRIVAIVKA